MDGKSSDNPLRRNINLEILRMSYNLDFPLKKISIRSSKHGLPQGQQLLPSSCSPVELRNYNVKILHHKQKKTKKVHNHILNSRETWRIFKSDHVFKHCYFYITIVFYLLRGLMFAAPWIFFCERPWLQTIDNKRNITGDRSHGIIIQ